LRRTGISGGIVALTVFAALAIADGWRGIRTKSMLSAFGK